MSKAGRLIRFSLVTFLLMGLIYHLTVKNSLLTSSISQGNEYDLPISSDNDDSSWIKPKIGHQANEPVIVYEDTEKSKSKNTSPSQNNKPLQEEEYNRANATFVTLARNSDLWSLVASIREVEDRFNKQFHYDWVFLNDDDFDDEFINVTSYLVSGKTVYGKVPKEHWSVPKWIDKDKMGKTLKTMEEKKIIYGGSVSYRHMCRFESGFFWRHPALDAYKYYWRVEPGIKLFCDVDYDAFKYMETNKLKYGFTISLYEFGQTIPTLWNSTRRFIEKHPEYIAKDNLMGFISNDGGETYNRCHFWSNFEIGDLDFWRGEAYRAYFEQLDQDGGFFYERWGDAPIHSIAASLFLDKKEVHYFDDIGYYHAPFTNCPTGQELRAKKKCICKPKDNFTWKDYSCTGKFYDNKNLKKPEGWKDS